jgi:hypothetical protein
MKKIAYIILILWLLYIWWLLFIRHLIDVWYTNAKSVEVLLPEEEKYKLPDNIINAQCVQFILKW